MSVVISYVISHAATRNCLARRYPVVLAATEKELVTGEETDPEVEPPPVISLSVVSQPGLPRRQVYYPYIAWRLSRVLQVLPPCSPLTCL